MRYSEDFIAKVREASNLVEIVGQYTELKGNGHRMMGRCPFPDHADKSPSFSVSEDQQLYFCYGCKKGGNVFTFLESFNGLAFPEAIEFLSRRASIPLPEREDPKRSAAQTAVRDKKDLFLKINKTAAVYYHRQLLALDEGHPAKLYLKKRGLSQETVEKFRLGVSLSEWQGLTNEFRTRNIAPADCEALGLIRPKKTMKPGDSHYDLFRERLMFPIFSAASDVIGFGGRTLGEALPKYVNSSDSPVFNKSKVLYGIHETGRFIRAQDAAIVVEGYMDAIALYTAGIKNVVAILGTAFTPEHAKLLKRYTLNVTMLLDGDEAGLNGAERSLPILLEAGLMPRGFALPNAMDPDDFIKNHGVDKLVSEIERAPELFTLLLTRRWMQNYHGTNVEKVRIAQEAAAAVAQAQNRGLLDLYMMVVAKELEVDLNWVRKAFQPKPAAPNVGIQGGSKAQPAKTPEVAPPAEAVETRRVQISLKSAPRDELYVLSLIVHHESLMSDLLDAGPDDVMQVISDNGVKRVLKLAIERYQSQAEEFTGLAAWLIDFVDMPGALAMAVTFQNSKGKTPEPGSSTDGLERKLMGDYLLSLQRKALAVESKALEKQIREQPTSENLAEFMALQRSRLNRAKD